MSKRPLTLLVFHQDGREFYGHNGAVIFRAKHKVKDFDIKAAEEALKEFLIWADDRGYRPQREA